MSTDRRPAATRSERFHVMLMRRDEETGSRRNYSFVSGGSRGKGIELNAFD